MPEFHLLQNEPSSTDIEEKWLWGLFDFIQNSGQTLFQLVDDTGTEPALYDGAVADFIDPSTVSAYTDWPNVGASSNGSYMVIEPVAACYPGGGKWQAKLSVVSGDLYSDVAHHGEGWTNAAQDFGASLNTGNVRFSPTFAAAPHQFYHSASDLETYNGGADTSLYLRSFHRSGNTSSAGLYIGGYIPADPTEDTRPLLVLNGIPYMGGHTTAESWGEVDSGAAYGRTPNAYTSPGPTGFVVAGVCGNEDQNYSPGPAANDYAGNKPASTIFVVADSTWCLGKLGPYTMMGCGVPNTGTQQGAYLMLRDFCYRWNP